MKQKLLLTLFIASINLAVNAQKTSVYAITGSTKGQNNWTEVRLIDIASGEELKTIFKNSEETQILNARTGKPVAKKDGKQEYLITRITTNGSKSTPENLRITRFNTDVATSPSAVTLQPARANDGEKIITAGNQRVIIRVKPEVNVNVTPTIITNVNQQTSQNIRQEVIVRLRPSLNNPFSTYSAACAFDKKHDRLYYTPMGIAQLRYIDLKSNTSKVFYFEDEQFGALRNGGDVDNQITRMVIGADGDGYALTNNAEHLIQFTTNKKATITDLGALTDAATNGKFSVHSSRNYGGDIIAAKDGDLYLITASHYVYQIDMKSKVATYKGAIQGLPNGYSTNGAAVEEGSVVLVNSSNSTQGLYRFDITTLAAEKIANSGAVYNASDLANANLLTFKKKKKEEETQEQKIVPDAIARTSKEEIFFNVNAQENRMSVFPNPVTNGVVTINFENYATGKYQAQLIDVTGKQLTSRAYTINSKTQTERFELPQSISKGNYLLNIVNASNKIAGSNKLVVQ